MRERAGPENPINQAGTDAADAKPKVDTLSTALDGINGAGAAGASGIATFADAIRALKEEIPGLSDQLADLDARSRIEGIYQTAVNKARTVGDAITAGKLRDEALAALGSKGAREAGSKGFLDLIGYAEGTDKGRGYNETLGYGAFTDGNKNLVVMTLDEIDALQTAMLRNPANKFNSSALGRYQIVQKTLRGLRSELGLSGSESFDADLPVFYQLALDAEGAVIGATMSNLLQAGATTVSAEVYAEAIERMGSVRLSRGKLVEIPPPAPDMPALRAQALATAMAYGNAITAAETGQWAGVEPLSWAQQREEALVVRDGGELSADAILPLLAEDKGVELAVYAADVLDNAARYSAILRAAIQIRRKAVATLLDTKLNTPAKLEAAVAALKAEVEAMAQQLGVGAVGAG